MYVYHRSLCPGDLIHIGNYNTAGAFFCAKIHAAMQPCFGADAVIFRAIGWVDIKIIVFTDMLFRHSVNYIIQLHLEIKVL
ncbi:hypothetical protein SDC9_204135 [bioreactor metagenome]|uniref:Uncharacterized protein n=1 Tax=bioreactor metagenome TaxID=1076179 RepID=A0A645IZ11_9ZZZZ